MRLFKCEIVREDGDAGKEDFTLTGNELEEYLISSDFTVHKAEKITVDREKIRETIKSKLQEAYREILGHHSLHSGDITPLKQHDMDSKEDELTDATTEWIKSRLV